MPQPAETRSSSSRHRREAALARWMGRERIFSFDVPLTAQPGDVCKVNLPDGTSVEVTLPAGAVAGAAIEFSAPLEDVAEHTETDSSAATGPVPCRIYWEGKPQRSLSVGVSDKDRGLSNVAVERIYAARLPPEHPPDELLYVELSPGGSILAVPVPVGTQPGSDVLFKAPDDEDETPVEVLMKGRLAKCVERRACSTLSPHPRCVVTLINTYRSTARLLASHCDRSQEISQGSCRLAQVADPVV